MYIYKFVITFVNGSVRNEWMSCDPGETIAGLNDRAHSYVDELESREDVESIKMTRRLVPSI